MKKMMTMALAAVAVLGLASCAKESGEQKMDGNTQLTVRIDAPRLGTRAIEAGVADGYKTPLKDGRILIFDSEENLIMNRPLNVALAEGAGQVIDNVPSTAAVYIVGNIDESGAMFDLPDVPSWMYFSAVSSTVRDQQDVSKVVLANANNLPKTFSNVDLDAGTADVSVNLAPVVSRLQLVKTTGMTTDGEEALKYAVTGVYVSNYYPEFTYTGGSRGAIFTAFADGETHGGLAVYRDEAEVTAVTGVAQNAESKVWGYNVAAKNIPYLIVKVKLLDDYEINGEEYGSGDELFLTVGGYMNQGEKVTKFAPGTIYNIANLSFTADKLKKEPSEDVALTLTVEVDAWSYVEVDGVVL